MTLGTVVSTELTPTPNLMTFVISEKQARESAEVGMFVQISNDDGSLVLAVIDKLVRTNKYYGNPDMIHGSASGLSPPQVYPSERWDYLLAEGKVLGMYKDCIQQRATQPVVPGSVVEIIDPYILKQFLGLQDDGLNLGTLRQMDVPIHVSLDKLLQKHLAVLSISGGGKSYATSVIIEEILRRRREQGRPALVLFDVHGEFTGLSQMTKYPEFRDAEVEVIDGSEVQIAVGNLNTGHFSKMLPNMSSAQIRELSKILARQKGKGELMTIQTIIEDIRSTEMNPMVQEALLGWMGSLKGSRLFGYHETPNIEEKLQPGKLLVINLAPVISLWKKQLIVYYFLDRIFTLRRERSIPPVVQFIEEAHQFCPEITTASSKGIIETIAREGRKFLCSLVLISQRPVNLSTTALSQCNSQLILKIVNPNDLNYIGKTSEGITADTLKMITSLGVGEGLLTGQAVRYPIFLQVRKRLSSSKFNEISMTAESKEFEKIFSRP